MGKLEFICQTTMDFIEEKATKAYINLIKIFSVISTN